MKLLVRESGPGYESERYQRTWLRLRARYCFLLALVLMVLVLLVGPSAFGLIRSTLPSVRDHYPWALLPLLGGCCWLVVTIYLIFGGFFQRYSEWPLRAGAAVGLPLSILWAAEWDGQIRIRRVIGEELPGGIWLAVAAALLALTLAVALRRTDFDVADGLLVAGAITSVLVVAPAVYVLTYGAWAVISWPELGAWAGRAAVEYWAVLALLLVVLPLVPGWRRYWRARTATDLEIEPAPVRITVARLIAGGVGVALAVGLILYQLPALFVSKAGLSAADYANAITQERRTLLAVLGALGAGVTLVYTHLRHQLDRDANATGRYTEAVQQLGNESMSIRLGGIYALARVARDSPGDRRTVTEVLAAFVRDGTREVSTGVALDVMAALTELVKTQPLETEHDWGDSVNLRSSRFSSGNLESVRFPNGVDLSQSDFSGAILRGAQMRRAILHGAIFTRTDLSEANLARSSMVDAQGADATLKDARMAWSELRRVNFTDADLRNADLTGSDLQYADLTRADLRGADLRGADLRHAVLAEARLEGADVETALLFGATVDDQALESAKQGDAVIRANILEDAAARKVYASWRRELAPDQALHGYDEYYDYDESGHGAH